MIYFENTSPEYIVTSIEIAPLDYLRSSATMIFEIEARHQVLLNNSLVQLNFHFTSNSPA